MAELEKLSKLTNLTTFAVHGNPIENLAGFRFYIIAKLPNLRHLNFW
jgi:Leucine-rich repeat (LRR) protein